MNVLQERVIRPIGSTRTIPVDVRVISATHRDLQSAMAEDGFREDLYYRLKVVSLALPPLARRAGDIPLLVAHFLKSLAARQDDHALRPHPVCVLKRRHSQTQCLVYSKHPRRTVYLGAR